MAEDEDQEQIMQTLADFVRDFESLDMDKLGAYFDDDATIFPRTVMSVRGSDDIELSDYLREEGRGPDSSMRRYAEDLKARIPGPPYMQLDPGDVKIQVFQDLAVVSFHLLTDDRLGRRTFVFVKRNGVWKIIHLHASNVQLG